MKRRDLLNQSEQRALDLLERALLGRGYRIYPMVPLRKIIEREPDDELSRESERMLRWGELDFLVVNREGGFGLTFGIEFAAPTTVTLREPPRTRRRTSSCCTPAFR